VSRFVNESMDLIEAEQKTVKQALKEGGLEPTELIKHIKNCLEAKTIKFDKDMKPIEYVNHAMTLKTLELIFKLRGDFEPDKQKGSESLIDLFSEDEKPKQ